MPLLKRIRSPSQPSAPWSKGWKVQLVFTKSSRAPLVITPAGQVLYKRAKKLVKEENSIKIEVKRANANNFRLGYSKLAGKAWLALVITHLNQGRMLANIETKEENSHLLEQHLREGRFDVIVFSRLGDDPLPGIKTTPLQRYQYVLVVAEDSPLAQLDEIRIAQIKDTPLIMRHKRFLSRTSLDRLFAARNGRQLLDGYCRGKRSRRQSHPLGSKPAKLLLLQLGDPREFHSK
jgi:DNA-binding transcriptional LysR family regulator